MENKDTEKTSSPMMFPMNGGEGPHSYANNSNYQKTGLYLIKSLMHEEITKKLDLDHLLSPNSKVFRIADVGCSVGPNTFLIVQDILEAVKSKHQPKDIQFQVFFNDQSANDFNTLFRTLPIGRNYFVAGVPGSFHEPLFPKASLHFVHSSYTIHWISNPKEIQDERSPAWNKERIHYGGSCKEVEDAYAAQFANDFDLFLTNRAEEVVPGGFVSLLILSIPTEINSSKRLLTALIALLGSTLMDMAKMDLVDKDKVDSFNVPAYFPSVTQVETLVKRNGWFKIEKMHETARPITILGKQDVENVALFVRAALEGAMKEHFGGEIVNELFNRFIEKLVESKIFSDPPSILPMSDLFVFLRRKSQCLN